MGGKRPVCLHEALDFDPKGIGLGAGIAVGRRHEGCNRGLHAIRELTGLEERAAGNVLFWRRLPSAYRGVQGETNCRRQVMAYLPEGPRADRVVTSQESFDFGHHAIEACEFKATPFRHIDPLPYPAVVAWQGVAVQGGAGRAAWRLKAGTRKRSLVNGVSRFTKPDPGEPLSGSLQ
jgi:hypothetical protein